MSGEREELMTVPEALSTLGLNGAPSEFIETTARTLTHFRVMLDAPDAEARVKSMAVSMVKQLGLHPYEVATRLTAYLTLLAAAPSH